MIVWPRSFVLAVSVGLLPAAAEAQVVPAAERLSTDIVIGSSVSMPSAVLGRAVALSIALPPGYQAGEARYPVLYALQSHFAGVSGLVAALSSSGVAPPMIVVSAGFDPVSYSLYADERTPGSGRADLVLQSIRSELVPFVEGRYRTAPYRVFLGHSSSALFLLYAMLAAPDTMQAVLAAGPMFAEFDARRIMAALEHALAGRSERAQILFYTQGAQAELTRDLQAFGTWLTSRRPRGLTWTFDPEPEANHGSLHIKTLYDGLRTLYADWATLPEAVALGGADSIRAHTRGLAARFGYDIGIGRAAQLPLRTKWVAEKRFDALVALAKYNCEERPEDFEAEWVLADAFERAGRWAEAASAWERCLAKARARDTPEALARIVPLLEARLAAARKRVAK